jgi:endonuclease III
MKYPVGTMLRRIEVAVKPFPKAAMFGLADEGYTSLFEQLVSCIISIRTLDETTIPLSLKLFAKARTPKEMLKMSMSEIADTLYGATFPGQKAETILRIAEKAMGFRGHELPADFEVLTSIKGVGPKCANLALGVGVGQQRISVDVHVHRVVNRWGLIQTKSPEQSLEALEDIVAIKYRRDINRLLMPFGKHICTLRLPYCSTCPVFKWCLRVGVTKSR